MPRKLLEPRATLEISLPQSLKVRIDLLCMDKLRGKPDYGKRSALIQQLLVQYLQSRGEATTSPDLAQPI